MVLLSIVFIFLPKLNVIDIAGSGIRIDDFFLLAVILLITLLSLLKISHFNMILSVPVFRIVFYLLKNPQVMHKQIEICKKTITDIRSKTSSSSEASSILAKYLIS